MAGTHCALGCVDLIQVLLWAVHCAGRWEEVTHPGPLLKGKRPGPIGTAQRRQAPTWSLGRWMMLAGKDRSGEIMKEDTRAGLGRAGQQDMV